MWHREGDVVRMMRQRRTSRRASCGYSLVELLVSSVIAGVIMVGAVKLHLANQQTAQLQNAVIHIYENGRFTLQFMRSLLRLAGSHGEWRLGVARDKAPPIIWSMTSDGARFDTLTVQYETGPSGGATCTGSRADPNTWYYSQYTVIPFSGNPSLLQLICRTGVLKAPIFKASDVVRTVGNGDTGILVAGADVFQVLYGVRRKNKPSGGPERYVPASGVDRNNEDVITVRIGVMIEHPDFRSVQVSSQLSSGMLEVLDQRYDPKVLSAQVGKAGVLPLRQVFETTVVLRNGPVMWLP